MDSTTRTWVVAAAGAAGAAYLLCGRRAGSGGSGGSATNNSETDFDSFLRAPRPAPTAAAPAAPAHLATSFEAFLKDVPAAPAPTDFAAFLRAAPGGGGVGGAAAAAAAPKEEEEPAVVVPEGAAPVLVLYGTEYGFAREIAEKAAAALRAHGGGGVFWPSLADAARYPSGLPGLAAQQAALLVFSTQGDGVPPTEARGFCDWLTGGGAGALPASLRFSVCALGDTAYAHFCRCGRTLDAALEAAGAARLHGRADVDKEDWRVVDAWISGALAALQREADAGLLQTIAELGGPAAAGVLGAAGGAGSGHAASGYSKSRPFYARVVAVEPLCDVAGADDKETVRVELALPQEAVAAGGLCYQPGDALGVWPLNAPAAVDELLALLGATGEERVARPSWHYAELAEQQQQQELGEKGSAGDDDGTLPLRRALEACYDLRSPKAQPLLKLLASARGSSSSSGGGGKPSGGGGKRSSIELHVRASSGDGAAEAPAAPAPAPPAVDALLGDAAALEAYLACRHVADVLRDFGAPFPAGALPVQELLRAALRPLAPRLYSISSSPLEAPTAAATGDDGGAKGSNSSSGSSSGGDVGVVAAPAGAANGRVDATIAVVRYEALGRAREGVCSGQVGGRLRPGDLLPVYVAPNPDFRLPEDPSTPVVMVGPGTGLAPFRAFIAHRLLQQRQHQQQQQQQQEQGRDGNAAAGGDDGAGAAVGPAAVTTHLFFGCRRRDQDFLYGGLLQSWAKQGLITLHTAFSREPGKPKVYVQQRLAEAADAVWGALERGGHLYVCGDAGSMAGAVEAQLLDIIAARLPPVDGAGEGDAAAAAAAYLDRLAAEGRYERDVWFS